MHRSARGVCAIRGSWTREAVGQGGEHTDVVAGSIHCIKVACGSRDLH
jgi:hypothetical protein